jgi:hypothetical protein
VIDLRFQMVKSSSYRAHSVGLGGSSPFHRGKNQNARGARAPGFRPLGPIPHRPSLGCSGGAVEPFDGPAFELLVVGVCGPAFELLVVGVWRRPSSAEPRQATGATERVWCRRRYRRVVVAQPRARGPSSSRLAPEREGQMVVAVFQPPSARAESAVVFLQKENGGQQYVVRQIPILRKEHLTVCNKKSKSNSFRSI